MKIKKGDNTVVTAYYSTGAVYSFTFVHLVVCLTTGPKHLPKPALHIVQSRASSFK
jgi:hypothetical protein